MVQDKINSFNAAFVDLAAAYVRRMANKIAGNETYTAEPPAGPLRWGTSLADEMRVANLLAATIGKMQAAFGGELPQESTEKEQPAGPKPVNLGPGVSFRLENTPDSGTNLPGSVPADALERLKNLCKFCHEMDKRGGIWAERNWGKDAHALEFAISVLSELREIKEVRIPAQTDTPGAWELMRDILAGKRPAPEGTVFDVVIDMTGNPQAIRRREELGYTARSMTLTMPGGDTVKLNSAAEAYGLAACIEKMAASVWPEAAPGK